MFTPIAIVVGAGAIGGIVNGVMADKGLVLPGKMLVEGIPVWRLGVLGNILIGAVAAFVAWALYGSGGVDLMDPPSNIKMPALTVGFSVLIGIAGPKYITDQLDKNILKKSTAMAMNADPTTKQHIMEASPIDVLKMAATKESH